MSFKITITLLCLIPSVFSIYIKDEDLQKLNNILDSLIPFQHKFPLNKDNPSPSPFAARLFKEGEIITPKIIEQISPGGKTKFMKETQRIFIYAGLDEKGIVGRRIAFSLLEKGFKVVLVEIPRIDGTHREGNSYFKRGLASTSLEQQEDQAIALIDSILTKYSNFEHHFLLGKGFVEDLASKDKNFPPQDTILQDKNLNHWRAVGDIASLRLEEIGNKDAGVILECYSEEDCGTTKMSEIPFSLSFSFNFRDPKIPVFSIGNPLGLGDDGKFSKKWNVGDRAAKRPSVKQIISNNYRPEAVFQALPRESTAIAIKSGVIKSKGLTVDEHNEYVTSLKTFASDLCGSQDSTLRAQGKDLTDLLNVENWVNV